MKKGDLSLNTIVVAAIVIIVLVVIIVIFANRIGGFNKGLADCANKGGKSVDCVLTDEDCCKNDPGTVMIYKFKSDPGRTDEDKACCLPIGK